MRLGSSYVELVLLQETRDNCAALFLIHTIQKRFVSLKLIREFLSGPKSFDSALGSIATSAVKNDCLLLRGFSLSYFARENRMHSLNILDLLRCKVNSGSFKYLHTNFKFCFPYVVSSVELPSSVLGVQV